MRILVAIPKYFPSVASGGVVRVAYNLCSSLAERGHDVVVVTSDLLTKDETVAPTESFVNVGGARVRYFPTRFPRSSWKFKFTYTPSLRAWIREAEWQPDVIHFHELRSYPAWEISRTRKWADVPIVVSPHGAMNYAHGRPGLKRLFDQTLLRPIQERATVWHALTPTENSEISRIIPEAKTRLIPNGVQLPDASQLAIDTLPEILYLGRVYPRKRIDRLIEALSLTKNAGVRLRIVGPDDGAREGLARLATKLGVDHRVEWEGLVSEERKLAILQKRPLFALTSDGEGMPMAVIEAMAFGCPSILTPAAAPEGVGPESALPVEARPESIAQKIDWAVENPQEANRIGWAGRKLVEERFGLQAWTTKFESLYTELTS